MDNRFTGKNLGECLSKAEKALSIPKVKISYKILKAEKGLFKKYCEIEVVEKLEKEKQEKKDFIKVEDNRILIKDDRNKKYLLDFEEGISIWVNGVKADSAIHVTAEDEIKYECEVYKARRELKVETKDKVEARLSIIYTPEYIGGIECRLIYDKIRVTKTEIQGKMPPAYTKNDILEALKSNGIVYGVLQDNIDSLLEKKEVIGEVIARGIEAVDDEDDKFNILFESEKRNFTEDSSERVDYKNLYSIANVNCDDVLAEFVIGKEGRNGVDIYGNLIKRREKKTLKIKVGSGCKLVDNKVIATMDGRPSIKNGVFNVLKTFETSNDVDIKSGNIDFIGDVKINGSVKEGMKVEAGNSLEISGNIEKGTILAQGEIRIRGSAINSTVTSGAKDLDKQLYLENLEKFKKDIDGLIKSVTQIKQGSFLGKGKSDGEIIKLLIETKFKEIPRVGILLISISNSFVESTAFVSTFIRKKIIGMGPLNIGNYNELYELLEKLSEEIELIKQEMIVPVDIYIGYCQDSKVSATGSIIIKGKGIYTSEIISKDSIEVCTNGSVVRGGILKAEKSITVKSVGSNAGVTTMLRVSKGGEIKADLAYQNTVFCFGERQYVLEIASKNVRAYLDKSGDVMVEKFIL